MLLVVVFQAHTLRSTFATARELWMSCRCWSTPRVILKSQSDHFYVCAMPRFSFTDCSFLFLFFSCIFNFITECRSLCVKGILSRRSGVLESPRRLSSTPKHERAFMYCTSLRAPLCTAAPPSQVDHHCLVLGARPGLQEVYSWFSCSASVVGKPPASQW